ncbi:MAG: DMT family transporter, partial [Alphaproteobacteria bacterium]
FLGALIIIRPGLDTPGFDATGLGALLLFLSAATFAFYQVLTRKLADQDSPETMIVYTALIAAVVMSCVVPFQFVAPMGVRDWLLFTGLGILGGFAQYFVVKALESAPASVVSPYLYGELLVAALLGYAIFGDFPDQWTWLGAAVIAASGLYIAYREGVLGGPGRA